MITESKPVRTRFAPSPTGFMHIGNFRTALFSHLYAKHNGGTTVLRIEDTDQNRKVEGALESLLRVMKYMGLEYDEGYYLKDDGQLGERGEFGPYLQSMRLELYQKHALELVASKSAYYCFCSEERLEEVRKEQTALKKPPMYDQFCRNLSDVEVEAKQQEFLSAGKNPVIRFAMPQSGQTVIHDLVYGDVSYENQLLDDQIILKSDKFPTYHLAVVVDDHYMQITHVIRGDDWIPSTPKHLLIYKSLGWEPTAFAHLPLLVNPDKTKLSKRQGDVAVEDFIKHGYLKEALLNFVAFLGWNPKTEQEIFSMDQLVEQFDFSKVNRGSAVFDDNKLDWINGLYIRNTPVGELVDLLIPYWESAGYLKINELEFILSHLGVSVKKDYLEAVASLEKDRLKKLSEIGERTTYFFIQPEYEASLLVWKKSNAVDAKEKILGLIEVIKKMPTGECTVSGFELHIKKFISEHGGDNGSVLWPFRVALTGMSASPGPFEVASTLAGGLGQQVIIDRLSVAVQKLS